MGRCIAHGRRNRFGELRDEKNGGVVVRGYVVEVLCEFALHSAVPNRRRFVHDQKVMVIVPVVVLFHESLDGWYTHVRVRLLSHVILAVVPLPYLAVIFVLLVARLVLTVRNETSLGGSPFLFVGGFLKNVQLLAVVGRMDNCDGVEHDDGVAKEIKYDGPLATARGSNDNNTGRVAYLTRVGFRWHDMLGFVRVSVHNILMGRRFLDQLAFVFRFLGFLGLGFLLVKIQKGGISAYGPGHVAP